MKSNKYIIAMIFLILFEAIGGILMLVNPGEYLLAFRLLFGGTILWISAIFLYYARYLLAIFLFIMGVVKLNSYFRGKEKAGNPMYPMFAVISMLVGVLLAFFLEGILEWIQESASGMGIILVIIGLFKLNSYFEAGEIEQTFLKVSSIFSGVLAIVFGIINAAYPDGRLFPLWQITGVVLIVEAILDIMTIIQIVRKQKRIVNYQMEESEP